MTTCPTRTAQSPAREARHTAYIAAIASLRALDSLVVWAMRQQGKTSISNHKKAAQQVWQVLAGRATIMSAARNGEASHIAFVAATASLRALDSLAVWSMQQEAKEAKEVENGRKKAAQQVQQVLSTQVTTRRALVICSAAAKMASFYSRKAAYVLSCLLRYTVKWPPGLSYRCTVPGFHGINCQDLRHRKSRAKTATHVQKTRRKRRPAKFPSRISWHARLGNHRLGAFCTVEEALYAYDVAVI